MTLDTPGEITIFGRSCTIGESSSQCHDDDLVEREAYSLADQISRLADALTVREFAALRLKIDGTFDDLLLA